MKYKYLKTLITCLLIIVIIIPMTSASAAPPNGVDHLRGRWDGMIQNLFGADRPFKLLLDDFGPDPNDPQAALYGGCMSVGDGSFAPVSARVVILGNEQFDMTLYGTAVGSVIEVEGLFDARGASVRDDSAFGAWQTANEVGDWTAIHHDRRNPKCPAVEIGDDLYFFATVYAIVGIHPDESRDEGNILEGFSNIVSSGMQVELPDGNTVVVPFYTDLFSPNVDFINEFRFLELYPDLPVVGDIYKFTLLDVFGQPIEGATTEDVWYACTMDAPRNVVATVVSTGIQVTWDAVTPGPGFDPGGSPPLGFYQIGLNSASGGFDYGAGGILVPEHLIPFALFGGMAPGSPDGQDHGKSLSELDDGQYFFEVISFSEGVPGSDSVGLECQIRAYDDQVQFKKSGDTITILP
jgi:hypothetical protein